MKRKTTEIDSATRNKTDAANAGLPYLVPKVALSAAMTGIPIPAASIRHEKKSWFAIISQAFLALGRHQTSQAGRPATAKPARAPPVELRVGPHPRVEHGRAACIFTQAS